MTRRRKTLLTLLALLAAVRDRLRRLVRHPGDAELADREERSAVDTVRLRAARQETLAEDHLRRGFLVVSTADAQDADGSETRNNDDRMVASRHRSSP